MRFIRGYIESSFFSKSSVLLLAKIFLQLIIIGKSLITRIVLFKVESKITQRSWSFKDSCSKCLKYPVIKFIGMISTTSCNYIRQCFLRDTHFLKSKDKVLRLFKFLLTENANPSSPIWVMNLLLLIISRIALCE